MPKAYERIEKGLCPICGHAVSRDDFEEGTLSMDEFVISGMCQSCQNANFLTEEYDES